MNESKQLVSTNGVCVYWVTNQAWGKNAQSHVMLVNKRYTRRVSYR